MLLEKRHRSDSTKFDCLISTSTIDFPVLDPREKTCKIGPSSPYYSRHVKGPALRYEVGVSIFGGEIVWTNGPFKAGCETESEIFESLKESIDPDEIAEQFSRLDLLFCGKNPDSDMAKKVPFKTRDRQKMVNDHIMSFKILQGFRHCVLRHDTVFHAIVGLVQLSIEKELETFDLGLETHNQLLDRQEKLIKSDE